MNKFLLSVSALVLLAPLAQADRLQPRTTEWLELQRSGAVASKVSVQAANEIEREKAVDRFIKTYDYAIPATFYGNNFRVGR